MMKIYAEKKQVIAEELQGIETISFTTDLWTSKSMKSFMAITYTYVDDNFEVQCGLLDFIPLRPLPAKILSN
jgi:hypothetical protein